MNLPRITVIIQDDAFLSIDTEQELDEVLSELHILTNCTQACTNITIETDF